MKSRKTIQMQMVLDAVETLKNHPTAEDVYKNIILSYPEISLATVYRNLNKLAKDGHLLRILVPHAPDRFDHNVHPHYHITCIKCNELFDISDYYLSDLDEHFSKITGFDIEGHDIVFKGICPNCKTNA